MFKIKLKIDQLNKEFPCFQGARNTLSYLLYSQLNQSIFSYSVCVRQNLISHFHLIDRLCGLVVRISGYRYRGLGFDSRRYQIF